MHYKDLPEFHDYLLSRQVDRPPDHIVVEWYAGESKRSAAYKGKRANIGFRYNIFNHIGVVSTLREAKQTTFPVCYEGVILMIYFAKLFESQIFLSCLPGLFEPTVFQVEAFNPRQCPKDDIWPCHKLAVEPDTTRLHWDHFKV